MDPTARIDAHQHFWRLARGDYGWLDAPGLEAIRRDVLPAELQPLLARHGVVRTVLVQAAATEAETEFLLEIAREHAFVGGVVGWVDLASPASVGALARWAAEPRFKGVRPVLQSLPEHDWIATRPDRAVVEALLAHRLRFDALVQPWHLAALLRFVQAWPTLPVVIDHAAKPQFASGWKAPWGEDWRRGMAALAGCPNVVCKVSGLLTEAAGVARSGGDASLETLRPAWELLLDHFGPARLMWGSDWPVLNLAADYGRWIALAETMFASLTAAEQRAIWHDNAARFYGL